MNPFSVSTELYVIKTNESDLISMLKPHRILKNSVLFQLPKFYDDIVVHMTTSEYNRILSGDIAIQYRIVLCDNGQSWFEALRWNRF